MDNLEICCGKRKKEGYLGLDKSINSNAQIIADVSTGLPFKANIFKNIRMINALEHFTDTISIIHEIHRVSKNNAKITLIVPHFSSMYTWIDPDHKKSFAYTTFDSFTKKHGNYDIKKIPFKILTKKLIYEDTNALKTRFKKGIFRKVCLSLIFVISKIVEQIANLSPLFCERVWCYYVGGFNSIQIELKVIK